MRSFLRDREGRNGFIVLAFFGLVALTAPWLADPEGLRVTKGDYPPNAAPAWAYPFGTDGDGRSVLTLVIHGTQVSIMVGLAATIISVVLGTVIGIASAHYSGFFAGLLNRITDWFLVIPYLPLAIVLATVFPPDVPKLLAVVIVIGVTTWPSTARVTRAQALAVEAKPYMERARVLGGGHWHQMTRHILPNVMPIVVANSVLTVSIAIVAETTLSFLGLGDPLRVSWGRILDDAYSGGVISQGAWWWVLAPGVALVLVVRSFTMCGRALERWADPRLEGR